MFKNSGRRAIAVAVIAVGLTVSFASHPLAGPGQNASIRNVILVHGAWAVRLDAAPRSVQVGKRSTRERAGGAVRVNRAARAG